MCIRDRNDELLQKIGKLRDELHTLKEQPRGPVDGSCSNCSLLEAQNTQLLATVGDLRRQNAELRSLPDAGESELAAQNQQLLLNIGQLRTQNAQLREEAERGDSEDLKRAIVELRTELATVKSERQSCLLYTSDAADDLLCVDLGGRRIIKKKNNFYFRTFHMFNILNSSHVLSLLFFCFATHIR
eukprot:TRINITY_DN7015_c0_g1_i1.p1 TRINITY_DN7015_c0_g1~~TRINITY_DN7015_c0_g1_i1.p1  ORF type:complete len:186 (+),score=64.81 TRINITY_DN7015_c0_g1_i1:173-730(+)